MSGRHRLQRRGPGRALRWLAGATAAGLIGAMLFTGGGAASASGSTVTATFSVLGVSTSNCSLSVGGSDIYLKPGDTLTAVSSAVGLTAGVQLSTGQLAGFASTLTTLPGTVAAHAYPLTTTKPLTISGLSAGTYPFTWSVTGLSLLGVTIPLSLTTKAVSAGAALTYAGTIHVTTAKPKCALGVQVPGPSVSVSVTGLPPIKISLPPVKVSVPVTVPSPPGTTVTPPTSSKGGTGFHYTPPPPSVPELVVPQGHGGTYLGAGSGFFGGALPDVSAPTMGTSSLGVIAARAAAPSKHAAATGNATKKPAKRTVELAANKTPAGEMPVVLAIVAVIALAVVTASYARLYLLRRP